MTSLQDFADDIQREPLYAAYRAAHEQIEQLGDDLLDDSIIQTAVKAYEAKLIEQGRLLPPGGEVSEQWAVRWHLPDGRTDEQDCHGNARETAEQRARRLTTHLPLVAVRGEALRRRIHTGPWEVVPDGETAR